jgi:hypothetical protein
MEISIMAINAGDTTYYQAKRGIVQDGLVFNLDAAVDASYPGNGTTWYDLAGSNSGTLTNGPTFDRDNGGSIVFDGTDDYVSIPLNITNSINYTFTFLLKSGNSTYRNILDHSPGTVGFGIRTGEGGRAPQIFAYDSVEGTVKIHTRTAPMAVNTVYYLSVWILTDVLKTHLTRLGNDFDAITLQSGVGIPNLIKSATGEMRLGRAVPTEYGGVWDSDIYSVQIYNRELSLAEVEKNYNAIKGRFQ